MKLVNRTHWRTADLRRIAARVVREEFPKDRFGDRAKKIQVHVGYNRQGANGSCSGYAHYHANWCTVNVSSVRVDSVDFAHVVAHELGHCKGLRHGHMPPHMESTTWGRRSGYMRAHFAWAGSIEVRRQPEKRKVRPAVDAKLSHARRMFAKASTRAKRAQTVLKKWQRKVRYYERQVVALPTAACAATVGLVLAFLLSALPAGAQEVRSPFDWPSALSAVAGQAADAATSIRFQHNGSTCTEANVLLGPRPSAVKLVAAKAAYTAGMVGLQWLAFRQAGRMSGSDRAFLRGVGKVVGYGSGAIGANSAIRNVRLCGF